MALLALACSSCSPTTSDDGDALAAPEKRALAVFAGGCYWTMEHKFETTPGVTDVTAGMASVAGASAGGAREGRSAIRMEAVEVRYDPRRVSYRQLVDRYWLMVDPTDAGGQACDRGGQYRAAVLPSAAQVAEARASRARAAGHFSPGQFVVPILEQMQFLPVVEAQQDFARKNPRRYGRYDRGCGRDAKLRRVWKGRTGI